MTYNYAPTANYVPQHFRHRPWWCRACWKIWKRMLLRNGIAPGGVDPPGRLYKDLQMVVGNMGCRGITPAFKQKLLPAEPQGTCGTPYTISIHNNASNNLDDIHLYIGSKEYKDPRKLGRGSRRRGSGSWRLNGDTAPALQLQWHRAAMHLK